MGELIRLQDYRRRKSIRRACGDLRQLIGKGEVRHLPSQAFIDFGPTPRVWVSGTQAPTKPPASA